MFCFTVLIRSNMRLLLLFVWVCIERYLWGQIFYFIQLLVAVLEFEDEMINRNLHGPVVINFKGVLGDREQHLGEM